MILSNAICFGQGHCQSGYLTSACPLSKEIATAPIRPVFASTGWKTVTLDHITFSTPNYKREAASFSALFGWTIYRDDGHEAVLDIGDWGSVILKKKRGLKEMEVESMCWVIEPWSPKKVEAALRERGLTPVEDNDNHGFESFHVRDPNGFDLQIANGNGLARDRERRVALARAGHSSNNLVGLTGWLDHISYNAADYKKTTSFYVNLLSWQETYDEGSQEELLIGKVGDIIIRGGNRNDPRGLPPARRERVDHISFGIAPWDTEKIRAALRRRRIAVRVDTAGRQNIRVSAYKSYHLTTPTGFDVQISQITENTRLVLSKVVRP